MYASDLVNHLKYNIPQLDFVSFHFFNKTNHYFVAIFIPSTHFYPFISVQTSHHLKQSIVGYFPSPPAHKKPLLFLKINK